MAPSHHHYFLFPILLLSPLPCPVRHCWTQSLLSVLCTWGRIWALAVTLWGSVCMPMLAALSCAESLCSTEKEKPVQRPTQFGKPQGEILTSPMEASGLFLKLLSLFTRNDVNYKSLKRCVHIQRRMHKHTLQLFIFPFFLSFFLNMP